MSPTASAGSPKPLMGSRKDFIREKIAKRLQLIEIYSHAGNLQIFYVQTFELKFNLSHLRFCYFDKIFIWP